MKETNAEDARRTNLIRETVTTVYEYAGPERHHIHLSGYAVDGEGPAVPSGDGKYAALIGTGPVISEEKAQALREGQAQNVPLLLQGIAAEKEAMEQQAKLLQLEAERLHLEREVLEEQQAKFKAAANRRRSKAMKGNSYAASAAKKRKKKR